MESTTFFNFSSNKKTAGPLSIRSDEKIINLNFITNSGWNSRTRSKRTFPRHTCFNTSTLTLEEVIIYTGVIVKFAFVGCVLRRGTSIKVSYFTRVKP